MNTAAQRGFASRTHGRPGTRTRLISDAAARPCPGHFQRRGGIWLLIIAAAILGSFSSAPFSSAGDVELTVKCEETAVTIADSGRPLLEYRRVEVPRKPYVVKLYSPSGVQVLRDAPDDHKHHHGLMFALAVDGVDFWSEDSRSGSQKSRTIDRVENAVHDNSAQAGFREQVMWTEPQHGKTLLVERRAIDVTLTVGPRPATLVTWRSRLSPPPGKDSVELTGSHYFGLGMRFLAAMDRGGRFFNATEAPGEVVRGTERLAPARWCAYTAAVDEKPVTVAIFDHPANPRYPNKMFTMTRPFAYLSATLDLWKKPFEVTSSQPLTLYHGVAVWDGAVEPADVEKLHQSWTARTIPHDPL